MQIIISNAKKTSRFFDRKSMKIRIHFSMLSLTSSQMCFCQTVCTLWITAEELVQYGKTKPIWIYVEKKCNQNIEFNAALELKHKIDDGVGGGGGSDCGVLSTPFMMAIIILKMAMDWGIRASYTDTF